MKWLLLPVLAFASTAWASPAVFSKGISTTTISASAIDTRSAGLSINGFTLRESAAYGLIQSVGPLLINGSGGEVGIGNGNAIYLNCGGSNNNGPASVGICGSVSATTYYGDGSHLTGVSGGGSLTWEALPDKPQPLVDISNSTGTITVTTVNASNLLGTVKTAAQASIKSLGTLTHISVNGASTLMDVSATGNMDVTGSVHATSFYGDGSNLTGIAGGSGTDRIISGTTGIVAISNTHTISVTIASTTVASFTGAGLSVSGTISGSSPGFLKAWVSFTGSGSAAIVSSFNITSIARAGTGTYDITPSIAGLDGWCFGQPAGGNGNFQRVFRLPTEMRVSLQTIANGAQDAVTGFCGFVGP